MRRLESVGYEVVRITEETPELWDEVDAVLWAFVPLIPKHG